MNIFILHDDPVKAAEFYGDKHFKIILEIAQMLCTVFHSQGIENVPYKASHASHPVTKWVGESSENFDWACTHAIALTNEKIFRQGKGHKSLEVVMWAMQNKHRLKFSKTGLTPFALAMPDQYKHENAVTAYRNYYLGEKRHLFSWKNRSVPEWIKTGSS